MSKVKMIANATFLNERHEGRVEMGQEFETTEERAGQLEKANAARRKEGKGPSKTKPAGPATTKEEKNKLTAKHTGGGWYEISDGEKVKGKAEAEAYIEKNS